MSIELTTVTQALYLLLAPVLALWLCRHSRIAGVLGPVVFAYLFGMLLPNLHFSIDAEITVTVRDLSIPLAIPLLLFTLNVREWLQDAGVAVLSFFLCIASLLVMAVSAYFLYRHQLAPAAEIAGMLTGMYSGGMPNMAVVHRSLEASPELFVQVNTVDIMTGGVYFLFLITLAGPLYGRFLVPYPAEHHQMPEPVHENRNTLSGLALAFTGTVVIVAVSVGLTRLLTGGMAVAPIMLFITTLAILASFWQPLRDTRLSYPAGYYLVLVFCCAIGSQVDLSRITEGSGMIAAMLLTMFLGTISLHLLLAKMFRVDRDTAIITQTAALYGPPFVPPVAGALRNPSTLLSGLTTGLVGYALGNYLGLGVGLLLR